ncbi:hypothetical protein SAMN05518672_105333 [Chitinophaga sp. CF118]|uniref:hypothetical protein n=1 Tax=Chitinophaga sp. CF118 TaxID=1884367 RepID=UPI0008E44E05|nr:hypothetical protein [Chitinophaga sp. CF118]SFE34064.1 hypothetical protein SAMN05518672_105333 [Chitinophaga sp. CF118]
MAIFVKSSEEQEFGRLVNLDLVTCIKKGDNKIYFSFDKDNAILWAYHDIKLLESDYRLIEGKAVALVDWGQEI